MTTLRFGSRAKKIKNKAKVNEERSPKELTRLLNRLGLRRRESRVWGGRSQKSSYEVAA